MSRAQDSPEFVRSVSNLLNAFQRYMQQLEPFEPMICHLDSTAVLRAIADLHVQVKRIQGIQQGRSGK